MKKNNINKSSKKQTKRSDPLVLGRFLEELSWLLESYDDIDFKALAQFRNQLAHSKSNSTDTPLTSKEKDDVTLSLVGSLPSVLADVKLFPANENIANFSSTALGIEIPRWNKKSRDELIGHIVCNTEKANRQRLSTLVHALEKLLGGSSATRKRIENDVKSGRSWNEVIQFLLSEK